MKIIIKAVLALVLFIQVACTHKIYIVRHAEKSTEPNNDPHLTEAGKTRAEELKKILETKNITAIFSTNTNRTKETATPLANANNATIQIYKNDTAIKMFANIFKSKQNALIVGHSNTILPLLQVIEIMPPMLQVSDWEYDNLLVVKYKKYCNDCTRKFRIKKVYYKKYGTTSKPL